MKRDRRPLHLREFIYTMAEASAVTGIARNQLDGYKAMYPGWPGFPTTKTAVFAFLQRNRLPRDVGRKPTQQANVVELIEVRKLTFRAAGKILGISGQCVHSCYRRYLRRKLRIIGKERFYAGEWREGLESADND